jgi:site-specific recombinase XerC
MLLYGAGVRLQMLRLRLKDIEFSRNEIIVRQGKGDRPSSAATLSSISPFTPARAPTGARSSMMLGRG